MTLDDQVERLHPDHSPEAISKYLGVSVEFVRSIIDREDKEVEIPEMPSFAASKRNEKRGPKLKTEVRRCPGCGSMISSPECLACKLS